jgi:excisionase family DNA binding protein
MDVSENINGFDEADAARLLSVKQVAAMLGRISVRTVWRMIAAGELKAVHIRGCTRVYLWSVNDYLKKQNQVACV